MKEIDLIYVCKNIGNLSGIPIRLFEDDCQKLFFSMVNLPKDPFILYKDEIFEIKDNIGYFITPFFNYYGVINHGNKKIVIGPTRQIKIPEQDLRKLAFTVGIDGEEAEEFVNSIKNIIRIPLESLLQMLSLINYILNGEKRSLEDLYISEASQEQMREKIEQESSARLDKRIDNMDIHSESHNTLAIEKMILEIVERGDIAALRSLISEAPAVSSGIIAKNHIRQAKNTFIVTATLASRAAIRGGMEVNEALTLSDFYIQNCEVLLSIEEITNLQYRMIFDYTERISSIREGKVPTKLAIEVARYVRSHLSEYITTDDIAKSLYMSRSRLSTKFKEEVGESLSAFIMTEKIREAKRLLKSSDRSFSSIAYYLGFSSQSHFSRIFKQYASLTPKEYREKHAKSI